MKKGQEVMEKGQEVMEKVLTLEQISAPEESEHWRAISTVMEAVTRSASHPTPKSSRHQVTTAEG